MGDAFVCNGIRNRIETKSISAAISKTLKCIIHLADLAKVIFVCP